MKKILALLLSVVMILMVSAVAFADSEPVKAVFVETTGGKVQGYRYDGIDNFLGIQYGTAERFQAPQAYSWGDMVRVCNVEGEVAPQMTIDTATRDLFNCFPNKLLQVQSEKLCLQLNVWTPESSTASARPVVVWLHGGGWSTGSSTQFNMYLGEALAKKEDVVFVSINHRLNCLGYLDVSAFFLLEHHSEADDVAAFEPCLIIVFIGSVIPRAVVVHTGEITRVNTCLHLLVIYRIERVVADVSVYLLKLCIDLTALLDIGYLVVIVVERDGHRNDERHRAGYSRYAYGYAE
jgi:hypothetical protein